VNKPVVASKVVSERQLMIPLVQAERAWAFAMQLKGVCGLSLALLMLVL
jgi:RNA-binding signal recognition particle 68